MAMDREAMDREAPASQTKSVPGGTRSGASLLKFVPVDREAPASPS